MKLSETFESIRICDDEKARRVLNVSREVANITADEIESGVTIERLAQIGVPVFRYSTQVTIHGIVPDFDPAARPMGYKAIFRNQNGSLGVKYVAIDGAKKKLICQASRLARARQFSAGLNSQGLELVFMSHDKETAIAAYRAFPKDLIIGGLYAARGIYGEFFVVADIGAVEVCNLWPLINALYGFASQSDLDAAQARADAEEQARHETWQKEHDEQAAATMAKVAAQQVELLTMLNSTHKPLAALPAGECNFIRLVKNYSEMIVCVYAVRRRGGSLCIKRRDYSPETASGFEPEKHEKMKRFDNAAQAFVNKAISAGFVFHVRG